MSVRSPPLASGQIQTSSLINNQRKDKSGPSQIPERLRKCITSTKTFGTNLGNYATVPEFPHFGRSYEIAKSDCCCDRRFGIGPSRLCPRPLGHNVGCGSPAAPGGGPPAGSTSCGRTTRTGRSRRSSGSGSSCSDDLQRSDDPHGCSHKSWGSPRARDVVQCFRERAAENRNRAYCASQQGICDCSGLRSRVDV